MTAAEVLAAHHPAGDVSIYPCRCGWDRYRTDYRKWLLEHAVHQLSALADAGFRVAPAEAPRSDLGGLAAREAGT